MSPDDSSVPSIITPRTSEDWARFVAYLIGASWALAFMAFIPASYSTVVSHVLIYVWSSAILIGLLTAAIGSATRRDTKVELSGLYIALGGLVLYLVAQLGFVGTGTWEDRIAFTVFVLFHISLMAPRVVGLEVYRRIEHRSARRRS